MTTILHTLVRRMRERGVIEYRPEAAPDAGDGVVGPAVGWGGPNWMSLESNEALVLEAVLGLPRAGVEPLPLEGLARIGAERIRQVTEEGYSQAHDDEHAHGELLGAAICLARVAMTSINPDSINAAAPVAEPPMDWPFTDGWSPKWQDPIRQLEVVGAFVAAEIDRLRRAETAPA